MSTSGIIKQVKGTQEDISFFIAGIMTRKTPCEYPIFEKRGL